MPRDLEEIVARQISDWRARRPGEHLAASRLPTVAISHTHGAGGAEIAAAVADELGFRLYDRELVDLVADDAQVSADLIAALDDEVQTAVDGHVEGLFRSHELDPAEHVRHLVRVVSTVASYGGVVIVGRAGTFFLDRATTVSVRIDAPFTLRMLRIQTASGLSDKEVRAQIVAVDDERAEFAKKHFRVTNSEPLLYDAVFNTARMGFPAAATAIAGLTRAKFPKLAAYERP